MAILEEYRDRFVSLISGCSASTGCCPWRAPASRSFGSWTSLSKSIIGQLVELRTLRLRVGRTSQGLNEIRYVKDIDQREDVLRMVMAGDVPQPIVAADQDDGT